MDKQNKTILITGASKGLGRAVAIQYSQNKVNLILVARSERLLNQVKDEIQNRTGSSPLTIVCDISCESDVENLKSIVEGKYQKIDVLINNAGFGTFLKTEGISNQEMRRHFAVNFFGAYYCIKALLPLLKKSQSAYILNIGSFFGKIAVAENSVYAATKFALDGLSQGLRQELKPYGIKVGLFVPGPIKTAFHKNRPEEISMSPKSFMLDPQKVAVKVKKMIQGRKKQQVFPFWMLQALKLKIFMMS